MTERERERGREEREGREGKEGWSEEVLREHGYAQVDILSLSCHIRLIYFYPLKSSQEAQEA